MMKRDIYQKLIDWKNSVKRKPLILEGARQTGKTYILKEFGKKEFDNLIYCNFDEEPAFKDFFKDSLKPQRILEMLSLYLKQPIRPGRDLIFFDEIQESNEALNSLKYFNEDAPEYAIIAAGSLLGVKLSVPKPFPVGKVSFLSLHPMSFVEFLDARGESQYRSLLENPSGIASIPEPIHRELSRLLKTYYFVGGMPEAVAGFTGPESYESVRAIQMDIIKTYALDFAKHAPVADIPKLSLIWDSVPLHLSRENKRFIFSAITKSARAREYENALRWLKDAGLIHQVFSVEKVEQPLAGFADNGIFKVYALDIGLLGAMARIPPEILVAGNELFTTYHGAFVENYAVQQLVASGRQSLYYWKSKNGQAEVDFLVESGLEVYPLEVKAGINPKSKSLRVYKERFTPSLLLRSTLLNLEKNGDILNVPLYWINRLDTLIKLAKSP